MAVNANAAAFKPVIFNYSIVGYSTYSVSINGYKILDEKIGKNGVKKLLPFLKKGVNTITIVADNNSNAPEPKFQVRLSTNTEFPSSDINDNTGNLVNINAAGNTTQEFTVTDEVFEATWDKTCDQSAALEKFLELNNAYAANNLEKVTDLLGYKAKLEALKSGTTEAAEIEKVQKSVAGIGSDLQEINQANYEQHIKFDVVKEGELYKIQSSFDIDGMSSGIEAYIGCIDDQAKILF